MDFERRTDAGSLEIQVTISAQCRRFSFWVRLSRRKGGNCVSGLVGSPHKVLIWQVHPRNQIELSETYGQQQGTQFSHGFFRIWVYSSAQSLA